MNYEIKQIAERLRGLRELLEIEKSELAEVCGMTEDAYDRIESGESDIPLSVLDQISKHYGMGLSVLMFGDEPHMSGYYVTRAGSGPSVERSKAYKYEALASGFKDRRATPFIVTVEPNENEDVTLNRHEGQEFNYIIEGAISFVIEGKEIVLNTGDSIYFNPLRAHGMKALNNEPAKFLAIIL